MTVPGPGPFPDLSPVPPMPCCYLFVEDPEAPAEQVIGYVGQHRVTAKEDKGTGTQGSGERGQLGID